MSRFSASDIVAIIMASCLGISLLVAIFATVVLDHTISETGARLLTTIGAGLVGALGVYIGRNGKRKNGGE